VEPYSYDNIEAELSKVVNDEDHYIINLTGEQNNVVCGK
jgi:hypothetical protein